MSCKVLRGSGVFFSLLLAPALCFEKSGMGDEKSRNKGPRLAGDPQQKAHHHHPHFKDGLSGGGDE